MTNFLHKELSDEEALLGIQNGVEDAFSALVFKYSRYFFKAAYRITLSKEDSEDIVQSAFLKLFNNKAHWQKEGGASFKTWFYKIVANEAIDFIRKRKKVDTNLEECIYPSQYSNQHQLLENQEESTIIFNALQSLNYNQRMAIELYYYSEMSQQDAAKTMGLNLKAYESLLSRGKDKLLLELKKHER